MRPEAAARWELVKKTANRGGTLGTFIDGLVSEDDARKIYLQRAKSFDERSISANSESALAKKLRGEEEDGWSELKKNKKSVRLQKAKPADRQFEDDVWCLLYRLGFKEFSADRNFTVRVGENSPPRQLDVFAKDDETIFIVECTHAQDRGNKSVKGLIDKINAIREDVIKAVHSHYGRNPKLKIKWAIATRNVDWRKADKDRAYENKIAVLTDHDITYFTKLIGYLKEAARYQFLARYLRGESVEALAREIPATKGSMGGVTFYNFLISPFDLLKISYISHRAAAVNDLETYQRMVKPARLKSIADFIDKGGQFPTNIVVNFKAAKRSLRFSKTESFENTTFGKLTLPNQYGAAWVIDGQHRLYGYAYSHRTSGQLIPVLAYENLPAAEEMRLFIDINSEQVKVSRSLLNEIYSNLNYGSENPEERLEAQYPRIALRLDALTTSPIRDRVVTSSKDKGPFRCLSLTSLSDGIKENRFLGGVRPVPEPGPLCDVSEDLELTTEKAADVIAGFFDLFAIGAPGNWQLGDAKGGFLCTNNGIRALLRLLKELILFTEAQKHLKAVTMDASDIVDAVAPLAAPVVDYFGKADLSEIQSYRSNQALHGVAKNCLGMMGIISETYPEFTTKELQEYLGTRDKEGTKTARGLIDEINLVLFNDVIGTLKRHYGLEKDAWWWQLPQTTRSKCDEQVNRDNGANERWHYLSLADYQTIVPSQWELFQDRYDFGDKGKKADKVSWIGRLNKIRQTTHHPEKGLISKEEVDWVKDIHAKVMNQIRDDRPPLAKVA
jgi:DNA sulfur modification protein DndB